MRSKEVEGECDGGRRRLLYAEGDACALARFQQGRTGVLAQVLRRREHVAQSVRRYLRDLDGCDADDVYEIVLREMEIPLFVEVLNHCEGNQSRAASMLGIHRATLRKKLKEYGITT